MNRRPCSQTPSPAYLGNLSFPPDDDYYDDFSFDSSEAAEAGDAAEAVLNQVTADGAAAADDETTPTGRVRRSGIGRSGRMHKFAKFAPKIELHAHLNGCIRESTLADLARERGVTLSARIHGGDSAFSGSGEGAAHPTDHAGETRKDRDTHAARTTDSVSSSGGVRNTKRRSLLDCFEILEEIRKCVDDVGALRRICREALEDFAAENVAYVELRSTPKRLLMMQRGVGNEDGVGSVLCSKRQYIETVLGVMTEFEEKEKQRYHREAEEAKSQISFCRLPMISRFLVSIDRSASVDDAEENVSLAKELFEDGNTFVVGVELGGNPTKNDFRDFEPALANARKAGLKVSVHCGEVPCSHHYCENENDAALIRATEEAEAVLNFAPDRIGHALLLPPSVADALRRDPIPVECCPTSNVMTLELATHHEGDLVEGLRRHPQLPAWLASEYPLSVSTDDSGVFNTNPTREILLLAKAFGLEERTLGRMLLRSLDDIFEPSEEVRRILSQLIQTRMLELFAALGISRI